LNDSLLPYFISNFSSALSSLLGFSSPPHSI
jgi:hypothetical protein